MTAAGSPGRPAGPGRTGAPPAPGRPGGAGPVLVIEDDVDVARAIRAVLQSGGLEVLAAGDGRSGLHAFHASRPGLVVLDVGLPVLDGWQVLDRIRELSEVPVLMVTSRSGEADKVRGLRAGADDYLTKPFGNAELLARVQALLRRCRPAPEAAELYDDGLVLMAFADHQVSVGGQPVSLTPTEFRLLAALVRHPARVLSPDQLLAQVWQDPAGIGPDRVKFAVLRLRRKLGDQAGQQIQAVRGFGYRYRPPAGPVLR